MGEKGAFLCTEHFGLARHKTPHFKLCSARVLYNICTIVTLEGPFHNKNRLTKVMGRVEI